jgi:hypothetical protein
MRRYLPLVFTLSALGFTGAAGAQEACGDTSCPKGYECTTVDSPCVGIPCRDGEDCRPCEPTKVQRCTPVSCADDTDCAQGMRCQTREHEKCSGATTPCTDPGDDGGEPACSEPAPVDCTTVTESLCVPTYTLPCEQSSDCWESGFTCEVVEQCRCGGAGGGSPERPAPPEDGMPYGNEEPLPSAAGDPMAQPSDCICEPTDTKACELVITECAEANDCQSGWTCEDNPSGVCWADANGNSGCEPADPPRYCVPPYASIVGDGRGTAGEGTNAGGSNGSDGTVEPPTVSPGKASNDDGGCSLGGAPGSGSRAWTLVILGVLGLVHRRRSLDATQRGRGGRAKDGASSFRSPSGRGF